MKVEIKQMPELHLGTIRHVGSYEQIGRAFARLGQILGPETALFMQHGSAMIAVYYDDPGSVPADRLRSDAAIVLPPDLALPVGLVEQHVPAGQFGCALHVGPYEQLGEAWRRPKGEWLPASGHQAGTGPSYEVYLNDPTTTPKPELRTEMYIPIAD